MMTAQIPQFLSSSADADAAPREEFSASDQGRHDFAAWLLASFFNLSPAPQTVMNAPAQDAESNVKDCADKPQLTTSAAASNGGRDFVDFRQGEFEIGKSVRFAAMNSSESEIPAPPAAQSGNIFSLHPQQAAVSATNKNGDEISLRGVSKAEDVERLTDKNADAIDKFPVAPDAPTALTAQSKTADDLKFGDRLNLNDDLKFSADALSVKSPPQTPSAEFISTKNDAAIQTNIISIDLPTSIDPPVDSLKAASDKFEAFDWRTERRRVESASHQMASRLVESLMENFPTPRQLSDDIKTLVSALKTSSGNFSEKENTTKDAQPNAATMPQNIIALDANPRGAPSNLNLRDNAPSVIAQTVVFVLDAWREMKMPETRAIRLLLHPKELGAVEIQLTRNANGSVSAHFIAAHNATRDALASGLAHLRESLARAGVAVEQLEVGMGLNHSSSQNQTSREERQRLDASFQNAPAASPQRSADATEQASVVHDKLVSLRV